MRHVDNGVNLGLAAINAIYEGLMLGKSTPRYANRLRAMPYSAELRLRTMRHSAE
jgi:hypothetical protein